MGKKNIFTLGVLTAVGLTLFTIFAQNDERRVMFVVNRAPSAAPCGNENRIKPTLGDSELYCQRKERREVCERLLRLGSLAVPEELQKECEAIAEESPDWLKLFKRFLSYVEWHREVYDKIARNLTRLHETRTLTFNCDIFKKCTGLGATVKSIATGVLAAMYTKRFFIADQLSYQGASCWADVAVLPNLIHWKVKVPTWDFFEEKILMSSNVAAFNTSNLHVFYGHPSIALHEFFCKDMPVVERDSATIVLCKESLQWNVSEYVMGRRYTRFILGAITRAAMHFSKAVGKQTNHRLILLRKEGLPSTGYLAVHLRTGMDEHRGNSRFTSKYLRTGKYIQGDVNWRQHIDCALQTANASQFRRPILLLTDSKACREWTRAHYNPEYVLVTNSSFFHFSKVAHRNPGCDMQGNLHDRLNEVVSEMDLMSRASILIPSSKSSFSEAAFYFSTLPQSQLGRC